MHPILAEIRYLLLYLALFFVLGLALAELLIASSGAPRLLASLLVLPLVLLHGFSCLASWYLCRSLPLRKARPERLVTSQVMAGLLSCSLLLATGTLWARILDRLLAGPGDATRLLAEGTVLIVAFAFLLFTLAVAVHYLLIATAASRQAERRAYELRLQARDAELEALRAQIDPHFLFNSLNSISGLVMADPATARTMCGKLAEFLRSSLRRSGLERVPISVELELAQLYLAVEKVRFGDRLTLTCEVDPAVASRRIPPLLLQPLVENAVRHGVGQLPEGGTILIRADYHGSRPRLVVENSCDPDRLARTGEGIGLENVRRRLAATFGDTAVLTTHEGDEYFRIGILLPATEPDDRDA